MPLFCGKKIFEQKNFPPDLNLKWGEGNPPRHNANATFIKEDSTLQQYQLILLHG